MAKKKEKLSISNNEIDLNENILLIPEIPDEEIEWIEEDIDVFVEGGIEFHFDDIVNDFFTFCRYMFIRRGFGEPTYLQRLIIEFIAKPSELDKMVQAPRGVGKSLISQLKVLWDMLRDNDCHILVRSASGKRSRNYTTFLLNTIKTTPVLQHLAPRSNQRKSSELFDVNGAKPSDSPTVLSAGIEATVTGLRASLCVWDDVEVIKNSSSPATRETLEAQVNENYNLLEETIDGDGNKVEGEVLCLGTFQTSESIYVPMIRSGSFETLILPAEYPEVNDWNLEMIHPDIMKVSQEHPEMIGKAIDDRLDDKFLEKRKLRAGKSNYELHYMLNPNLNDELKYPLKLKDLIVADIDFEDNPIRIIYSSENKIKGLKHKGFTSDYFVSPQWQSEERLPFDFTIIAVDPSGRGEDETGWIVISLLAGKLYIRDFGGVKGGYDDESLDFLVNQCIKYNVNALIGESNFGDGAYIKMLETKLKEKHNCQVEEVRATAQKEARIIDTLEPLMNQHRLIVDRGCLERDNEKKANYSLTYQMTHITRERGCLVHDDIIDVWQLGCQYLVEYMAQGDDKALKKHEEIRQKRIDDLFENGLFPELRRRSRNKNYGSKF